MKRKYVSVGFLKSKDKNCKWGELGKNEECILLRKILTSFICFINLKQS